MQWDVIISFFQILAFNGSRLSHLFFQKLLKNHLIKEGKKKINNLQSDCEAKSSPYFLEIKQK